MRLDVDQFYGIEIEEFPAQIAQVALWLMDHQMNQAVSEEFGRYFARLPLKKSPTIVHGNALQLDWASIVPAEHLSYILGNPPFGGSKYQTDAQRAEITGLFEGVPGAGILDYVTGWYIKAARFIKTSGPEAAARIRCALVSTNSITQGEQAGVLWPELLRLGAHIHFAHRTFQWSNEARGVAAVHCVIIGFALHNAQRKTIFDYDDPRGEPHALAAANINPYLVDAADIVLPRRDRPICPVPEIGIGNKPIDGGNYLFTAEEKADFLRAEPAAKKYFRRWIGSDEFINGYERWCLWLGDCPPDELRRMPEALKRVEAVRAFRLASKSAPTRKLAETPTRFHVENIPDAPCLVIPEVSSERRRFIPMGFMPPDTLCSNLVKIAPDATRYHFGVLNSTMHMAWVRYTCGRLKSDYRYSAGIVYNNFPWPETLTRPAATLSPRARGLKDAIESAAQGVLDARARFPGSSLADLYDPLTMPPALTKAHQALDRAVDAAYLAGTKGKDFANDAERVAYLFQLYQECTSLLPAEGQRARRRKRAS
ncbi:MAG: class I SAM-dependent DNA methyltransferase [Betaproteobacteria bacterium]|nr:class I SAM-dependent DNA methyltransferase [Betaproteobacteria bacterium]